MLITTPRVIRRALALGAGTLSLLALSAAGAMSPTPSWASAAAAARTRHAQAAAQALTVNERSNLRLVSHHSGVLYEQGSSSGTPGGRLTVQIKISYTQASITFVAYPSGGTLSGRGQASFYAEGSIAHFNGSVAITHGTGRYASASASRLHIEGTFQRRTYAMSLAVSGKMGT